MKTIYITEEQKNTIKENYILTEARADRKLKEYIVNYTNGQIARYLDTPLEELPYQLKQMCNPGEGESQMYTSVKNNQTGNNKFSDFLRLNFYSDFGLTRNRGPKKYMEGIARIALVDLGYYTFDNRLQGAKIVKLSRYMRIIAKHEDLLERNNLTLDGDLNGLSYNELMEYIQPAIDDYIQSTKGTVQSRVYETPAGYRIVEIKDIPSSSYGTPSARLTSESYNYLASLQPYTDWCICGSRHSGMYEQYTCGGGKFYICEKDGFENIPREQGENCPLDEYGLSLISVLVAPDGLPERITTRWNHDYGGEDDERLDDAIQLQDLLKVKYLDIFKPRTPEELHTLRLDESKVPSAQDQVKNKVNAGVMDAVTAGGTMEEGAEPESNEYTIGGEKDAPVGGRYYHVNESSKDSKIEKFFPEIADFMKKNGLNVMPMPKVKLDWSEQDGLFIKTGFYEPEEKSITLFCKDRHPKDILRSFAHEMIHHEQNLDGKKLEFSSDDNVKDNKKLEKLEAEAYLKGNIIFRKWTEYKTSKKSLNESKENSWIYEETSPEDVDLSSFNIKKELNPKFWKNGLLDSRIRMKLMDIADDFIEFLGVNWVEPEDIIITGSLANFNWDKKYSDIDLHVLMDFSKVDKRKDFVKKYFDSLKNLWNEEHGDLSIFGFPVEVYVQDVNEKHTSSGVYSLDKNEWVKEPERKKMATSKVNKNLIKNKVANYINKIDNLEDEYKKANDDEYKTRKLSEKLEKIFDDIKNERKKELNGNGGNEISNGNIIFKCLRRLNYIDKLYDLKTKTYDKMNSLP